MPDTQSAATQVTTSMVAEWPGSTFPVELGDFAAPGTTPVSPNPLAAVALVAITTLTVTPLPNPGSMDMATLTQSEGQAVPEANTARAQLKARYKAMPKTAWFRAAHENRSLGESIKTT